MYKKKFTILDIYDSGYMEGFLPNINRPTTRKIKTSTGDLTLINQPHIQNYGRQIIDIINSSGAKITKATYSKQNINVRVAGNYAEQYEKIVNALELHKGIMKYANSNKEEIEMAIKQTMNAYVLGKEMPKLALRINSLEEIKGMNEIKKKNLLYNIIESITFDDDFKETQDKLGLRESRFRLNQTSNATWAINQKWDKLKEKYERRLK
jgi:hypothetical protein